jgi:multimeric flavodoxin WrbA
VDGALTEKVILSKFDIRPCRGCDACGKTGKCVQQDDLPALLEQIERNQVWVLGTPVYYCGPTAQFRAFVDRWSSTEHQVTPKIVEFKDKRVVLAIPLGGTAHDARHTVGMIEDALAYKKSELFAIRVASGVMRREAPCATTPRSMLAAIASTRHPLQPREKRRVARASAEIRDPWFRRPQGSL